LSKRTQNEKKFQKWEELPGGGRLYQLEVKGRFGWLACYKKEVNAGEETIRFWQEIYDEHGRLVETHEKYPLIQGTKKSRVRIMIITKQYVADKIGAYLRHETSLPDLVDWSERALMEGEFDERESSLLAGVIARLGVADVRAFGLAWEDCEEILAELGFVPRVELVVA
jgi:hypothetical protein